MKFKFENGEMILNIRLFKSLNSLSQPGLCGTGFSLPELSGPSMSQPELSGPGLSQPRLSGPGLSQPGLSYAIKTLGNGGNTHKNRFE